MYTTLIVICCFAMLAVFILNLMLVRLHEKIENTKICIRELIAAIRDNDPKRMERIINLLNEQDNA